jgi:formyltetrahydrofolate hydrolase
VTQNFILAVSCPATSGIVSAVTSYLADSGCYISELAQFDDEANSTFFMRAVSSLAHPCGCRHRSDRLAAATARRRRSVS